MTIEPDASVLQTFWDQARAAVPTLPHALPEAWAFGATAEQADSLLSLVLAGIKTGTASSLWDYDATGDPLPRIGELSILLDSSGHSRSVIETTDVRTVPFDQVTEEHARAEGEGDRTLRYWRVAHEAFWRAHSENPRGFEPDMPVVCELFRVLYTPES